MSEIGRKVGDKRLCIIFFFLAAPPRPNEFLDPLLVWGNVLMKELFPIWGPYFTTKMPVHEGYRGGILTDYFVLPTGVRSPNSLPFARVYCGYGNLTCCSSQSSVRVIISS